MGVWNYSKQKDASALLVRYLTASPDVALTFVDVHNSLPAHMSGILHVAEDPKFNNFPDTAMKLATYESANHCATRGRTPGFLEFEEIVNTSFEDIRNGGDPASVMQSAETRIEQSMRRYK
jgi:multiple sugar transport system substrate-binding protein